MKWQHRLQPRDQRGLQLKLLDWQLWVCLNSLAREMEDGRENAHFQALQRVRNISNGEKATIAAL